MMMREDTSRSVFSSSSSASSFSFDLRRRKERKEEEEEREKGQEDLNVLTEKKKKDFLSSLSSSSSLSSLSFSNNESGTQDTSPSLLRVLHSSPSLSIEKKKKRINTQRSSPSVREIRNEDRDDDDDVEEKQDASNDKEEEEEQVLTFIAHRIQPADTLLSIALQYDVSIPELMLQNRLSSTDIWFKRDLTIPVKRKKKKKEKEAEEGATHQKINQANQQKEHLHPSRSVSGVCTPQSSSSSSLRSSYPASKRRSSEEEEGEKICEVLNREDFSESRSFSSSTRGDSQISLRDRPRGSQSRFSSSSISGGETKRSESQAGEESRAQREKKEKDTKGQQSNGLTSDGEYRDGGIPTSIHRSAYAAMMASSLVLQEDVDIQLVRAQLAFRNGDVEAALVDCRLLHRWKEIVGSENFSVPEVLAYLTVHDGDVQKAWRAMRIDTLHKRRNAGLRRGEEGAHTSANTSRAGLRGSLSSLFLSRRFLFNSSPASSARYFRLQDDSSIYFDDLSSNRNPTTSPTIIGKRSSSSSSSSSISRSCSSSSSSFCFESESSPSPSIPMSELRSRTNENEKSDNRRDDLMTGQSTCLSIVEESSSSVRPTLAGETERERRLQGSERDKKKDRREERSSKREDTLAEKEEQENKRISLFPYGLRQRAQSSTSDLVRKSRVHGRGKQIYLEMSEL